MAQNICSSTFEINYEYEGVRSERIQNKDTKRSLLGKTTVALRCPRSGPGAVYLVVGSGNVSAKSSERAWIHKIARPRLYALSLDPGYTSILGPKHAWKVETMRSYEGPVFISRTLGFGQKVKEKIKFPDTYVCDNLSPTVRQSDRLLKVDELSGAEPDALRSTSSA